MSPTLLTIWVILISITMSAFFSGMEIAFVTANRLRLEMERKKNTLPSRIIKPFRKYPAQFITTMLIGNNIALVVYGIFMGSLIIKLLFPMYLNIEQIPYWLLLIQTIISTIIILVTAEFLPKVLFRINPRFTLNIFSIPALFFYILFYPITKITMLFSKFIIKHLFRYKFNEIQENNVFSKTDLTDLIKHSHSEHHESKTPKTELTIFKNVLDFSEIKIRECAVPRTEIIAIEIKNSINELTELFVKNGFSRVIVFRKNIDNVIGYVHSSELFKKPKTIKSIITPIPIVPETMPANKLLSVLNDANKGIALVVDEFGGTAGIVTVEDIIEEIVGEIEDEHDDLQDEDRKINDKEYIFSGRIEIDFINEKYNLSLPKNEAYETVAGLILNLHGSIPKKNDIIEVEEKNMILKVLEASKTKIDKIHLRVV